MNSTGFPRRSFLKRAALVTAGAAVPGLSLEALTAEPAVSLPERVVLSPVAYSQVTLAAGVAEKQRTDTVAVLLSLSDDELLKPYRERSGKPAPGAAIGGWYDAHAYCPGHTFGQWLSAFSRSVAIDGSDATRMRVNGLVKGLGASMDSQGSFFGGDNRFPAYTLEKLNCGLIDALAFAQDADAVRVLRQVNELAQPHLPEKALSRAEQRKRSNRDETYSFDESYTLPENYFLAYQRTGDVYYRELAQKFMHSSFLDPLAEGQNVLPGLHAYSHLNALNSAVQSYLLTADEKSLKAAVNGFEFIRQQSFASGGWGPDEGFVTPGRGELAQSLRRTHSSFETPCGAYGHFKLTRSLLSITGDGRYGDSMEAVMLNTILGSLPLQPDGKAFYYSDYNLQARKVYHGDKWPCCSGTLAQAASDYRINAYLRGRQGLYVNLYTPSTVRYSDRGMPIEVSQSGQYPFADTIHFNVRPAHASQFALSFRIPEWAGSGARATLNGNALPLPQSVNGFSTIRRHWRPGDQLALHLPLTLRTKAVDPETPGTVALLRGPLLLYGVGNATPVTETALLHARQMDESHWTVQTQSGERVFTSFAQVGDASYSAYHQLV